MLSHYFDKGCKEGLLESSVKYIYSPLQVMKVNTSVKTNNDNIFLVL